MSQKLSDILGRSTISPNKDDKSLKQDPNKVQIVKLPSGNNQLHVSSDAKSNIVQSDHNPTNWTGVWKVNEIGDIDTNTGASGYHEASIDGATDLKDEVKKIGKYLEEKGNKFLWKISGNILSDFVPAGSGSLTALSFLNRTVSSNSWIGKEILSKDWFKGITNSWISSSASKFSNGEVQHVTRGGGKYYYSGDVHKDKSIKAPTDVRLTSIVSKWQLKDAGKTFLSKSKSLLGISGSDGEHDHDKRSEAWASIARKMMTSSQIQGEITTAIKAEADELGVPVRIPDNKITYFGGNIQDAVYKILAQDVIYGDVKSGYFGEGKQDHAESNRSKAADGKSGLIATDKAKDFYFKYGYRGDPYNDIKSMDPNGYHISLNDVIHNIRSQHIESDYHILSGFEIGSNHDWMIRLAPYIGPRGTCVPPLPCYMLPRNAVMGSDKSNANSKTGFNSSSISSAKASLRNHAKKISNKVYAKIAERIGTTATELEQSDGKGNFFSFGHDCPCLTYNFNIGTIKTDQLKLWNGDTLDTFNGMNYHMTLNMSVLDDLFGSFTKYWNSYINECYNPTNSSMAPYWASLFVIELIIFRTGKQINWHYKLIGSPIEWSPSFTGEQSPNEMRVDITFGIVGIIQPTDLTSTSNSGYNEPKVLKASDSFGDSWYGNGKGSIALAKIPKGKFGIQVNMTDRISDGL